MDFKRHWFWLSFCDTDKPEGERFLGGCLVQGADFGDAVHEAHRLGINPGGEVAGWEIEDGMETDPDFDPTKTNRLLSLEEIKNEMGGAVRAKTGEEI